MIPTIILPELTRSPPQLILRLRNFREGPDSVTRSVRLVIVSVLDRSQTLVPNDPVVYSPQNLSLDHPVKPIYIHPLHPPYSALFP